MNEHDIAEQAYKNGYEQGKRDAVKHGRWESWGTFDDLAKCSVCGADRFTLHFARYHNFKFCPNCGARMDGDVNA